MQPRKPTEAEKKELQRYLEEVDNYEAKATQDIIEGAYIAVFDDYSTGSPGYFGKVMIVVYDGGPSQTETYIWERERNIGEENLPSGQISWQDGKHEPKIHRVVDIKE